MTTPTTEPTTAQVDAALEYYDGLVSTMPHGHVLAAEVRRLRAVATESERRVFEAQHAGAIHHDRAEALRAQLAEKEARIEKMEHYNAELQGVIDNNGYPSGADYDDMEKRAEQAEARNARLAEIENSMALLTELHATEGAMEAHIRQRPELSAYVAKCFAAAVMNSPNYTEMRFVPAVSNGTCITVTVKKHDGKTPHEKRIEAEQEAAKLRAKLAEKQAELAQNEGVISRLTGNLSDAQFMRRGDGNEIFSLRQRAEQAEAKLAALVSAGDAVIEAGERLDSATPGEELNDARDNWASAFSAWTAAKSGAQVPDAAELARKRDADWPLNDSDEVAHAVAVRAAMEGGK